MLRKIHNVVLGKVTQISYNSQAKELSQEICSSLIVNRVVQTNAEKSYIFSFDFPNTFSDYLQYLTITDITIFSGFQPQCLKSCMPTVLHPFYYSNIILFLQREQKEQNF